MMNNGFKIIALEPLEECNSKHLKVLKKDTIYYFYQDYNISGDEITCKESYPVDLFNENNLKINISAIVGKNGSGKSTLVELLFKGINNIAFNFKEEEGNENKTIVADIKKIEGVHLNLYIEKNDEIFKINVLDIEFNVYKFNENGSRRTLNRQRLNKFNLSNLFYTEVINYSHYAYNSKIEGEWIQKLFHKNDSYQTPIVFNPMRTIGNIDINVENDLVRQRLITNLLNPPSSKEGVDFRKIGDNLTADKIILELKPEKKEIIYDEKNYLKFNIDDTVKQKERKEILNKTYRIFFEGKNFESASIESDIYKRIESYVVYKLISITYKYVEYENYFNKGKRIFKDNIDVYLRELKKDDSHIVFKLKQTLNFLHYNHVPFKAEVPIFLDELSDNISDIIGNHQEGNKIIDLIPPPIFYLDILLKNINGGRVGFSSLSSGEKQFIYSISSILYHLKNIDSVSSNKIQYKNINIVFEEVELYFHPNLQRKLINELLRSIGRIGLKGDMSLNIIFVTHSPFILSDIPSSNVMFLKIEDGKSLQNIDKRKTFGANIHELLRSNFFFSEGVFIGEFAKDKIDKIIKELNSAKEDRILKEDRVKYINEFISTIDERIIRIKLREMLYEVSANRKETTGWIDKEIEYLMRLKDIPNK